MIPFWRYIEYTDDGCALYECLSCHQQWEGRTAPGWVSDCQSCEATDEGAIFYGTEGCVKKYYKTIPAVYKPTWTFCPYCGIKWKGPVRVETDNEKMLGPRRKGIKDVVDKYWQEKRFAGQYDENIPYWYVIFERETRFEEHTPEVRSQDSWTPYEKMSPTNVTLVQAYEQLQWLRMEALKQSQEQLDSNLFGWDLTEYRLEIRKADDPIFKGHPYISRRYRV